MFLNLTLSYLLEVVLNLVTSSTSSASVRYKARLWRNGYETDHVLSSSKESVLTFLNEIGAFKVENISRSRY